MAPVCVPNHSLRLLIAEYLKSHRRKFRAERGDQGKNTCVCVCVCVWLLDRNAGWID